MTPSPDEPAAPSHRQHTNRLINEQSPYLLQHAHNPVDWFPWSDEAFEKAKKEDKPVLVSIGYAACHWCHVMERESFEDEGVAAFMNDHFVNIKVDREERPDIDHIYMDAVQAMTGSGGWPLNIFVTPDRQPFYGGTYFPPERMFNRPSWKEVLVGIAQSYIERKAEVKKQAENLTHHLQSYNFLTTTSNESIFTEQNWHEGYQKIMETADRQWGGFGRAPKFPQTFTITFLLKYAAKTGSKEAASQGLLSLDKMIQGGIYDQVGGGFARYSTDNEWLAPHFEKMLYDNALLISTMAEALRFTGQKKYALTIKETITFIIRELTHPDGGFYSALDADSEGEEGKFYVWDYQEVVNILGPEAQLFCQFYDISPEGNWEHKNILRILTPSEKFAAEHGMTEQELNAILERGKQLLLEKRASRVRPGLDDKILLGWNALMNTALSNAFAATGNEEYKELAIRNMHFLYGAFHTEGEGWKHSWKKNMARYPAFLDDYACLIAALINLAQITADFNWLNKANELVSIVLEKFSDNLSPLFFYTAQDQKDVLLRKKEFYDSATPSGNSVMAVNLYQLSIMMDRQDYRKKAEEMLSAMAGLIIKYPGSFMVWFGLLAEIVNGTEELVIIGKEWSNFLNHILKSAVPYRIIMAAPAPDNQYPLLSDKPENEKTRIYICKNYVCDKPEDSLEAFYKRLKVKYF